MQRKLWICLALVLIIPGLILTTGCGGRQVTETPVADTSDEDAKAAQLAAQKEAERKAAEAKRIADEEAAEAAKLAAKLAQEEKATALAMFTSEDIYFAFDNYNLMSAAQDVLMRKAEWLQANPSATVTIEGHCDERGTNAYNLALGEKRAQAAKNFLVDLGISADRMDIISYGEEAPVDLGHDEEAWAKNRRAHFFVKL